MAGTANVRVRGRQRPQQAPGTPRAAAPSSHARTYGPSHTRRVSSGCTSAHRARLVVVALWGCVMPIDTVCRSTSSLTDVSRRRIARTRGSPSSRRFATSMPPMTAKPRTTSVPTARWGARRVVLVARHDRRHFALHAPIRGSTRIRCRPTSRNTSTTARLPGELRVAQVEFDAAHHRVMVAAAGTKCRSGCAA